MSGMFLAWRRVQAGPREVDREAVGLTRERLGKVARAQNARRLQSPRARRHSLWPTSWSVAIDVDDTRENFRGHPEGLRLQAHPSQINNALQRRPLARVITRQEGVESSKLPPSPPCALGPPRAGAEPGGRRNLSELAPSLMRTE